MTRKKGARRSRTQRRPMKRRLSALLLCRLLPVFFPHPFGFAGSAGNWIRDPKDDTKMIGSIEVYECPRCLAWFHRDAVTGLDGPVTVRE